MEKNIAKEIFELSENNIYIIIEQFESNQVVDKSLVYCFIKAFYIHTVKRYLNQNTSKLNFDTLYTAYKQYLKLYYKTNNPNIEDDLLDQILNFFDNSFSLIDTVTLNELDDSYEFRHYTINVFELLRMILEKNSKSVIRENIFDNHIRKVIEETEEILKYIHNLK